MIEIQKWYVNRPVKEMNGKGRKLPIRIYSVQISPLTLIFLVCYEGPTMQF